MSSTAGHTLKHLRTLHRAMMVGLLLFGAVCFYLRSSGSFDVDMSQLDQLLQLVSLVLSAAGFYIGYWIFKKRMLAARDELTAVADKATVYRSAAVLQWALLEGPALFSTICFLLTGNLAFLALSATLCLLLFLVGPSKMKIMLLLRISDAEMELF